MSNRWDETWHRLREWTNGQGRSERLAAQIVLCDGYASLDPSHPLGGPDGGRDALCEKNDKKWVMAVFFPRGQQPLGAIKSKFMSDLRSVASHGADGLAFVTNQELSLGDRRALNEAAGNVPVALYHLERITTILDQPAMESVREQFLDIGTDDAQKLAALHLAEAEARLRVFPRVVPAGFAFSGGIGTFNFQVQNETQSLFRAMSATCHWTLDPDALYAWLVRNHVRRLQAPDPYEQRVALEPTVVRIEAPLHIGIQTSSSELNAHFQGAVRRAADGELCSDVPTLDLVLGEIEVLCQSNIGGHAEHARFRFRWG